MPAEGFTEVDKQVLDPEASRAAAPALLAGRPDRVWVYRYADRARGWTLSIATHAEPGSGKLSLGGFRIAPEHRTSRPDFDTDREAIGLAIGMEEKIYWSRLIRAGGPLALRDASRIVGGKCVLRPTSDARVGQPRDRELLDFAIACFRDFEATSGVYLTTGQDLGHGMLADGSASSLEYVHARFPGSVLADTSKPTAAGNCALLRGVLRALDIAPSDARIGLIGLGNIGMHVLRTMQAEGSMVFGVEASPERRAALAADGVRVRPPEGKTEFLQEPMDALVVNAAGGTLDMETVRRVADSPTIRLVCGCENLTMPDPSGAEVLRRARKIFCPTEFGGMMGYLTAVEEYLAYVEGEPFDIETMCAAADRLEVAGYEAASHMLRGDFAVSFEDALRTVFKAPATVA